METESSTIQLAPEQRCVQDQQQKRRRFTAEDKIRIYNEAEACCSRGQLSELLRREQITHAHLANWRRQIRKLGFDGFLNQRPGPKARIDGRDDLIEKQQRAIEVLERELSMANALLELQKKARAVLGKAQPAAVELI